MEWGQVQSIEELKQLGRLKDVAGSIANELGNIKVPKNSWDNLWTFIKSYSTREQIKSTDETKTDWQLVTSSKELKELNLNFREMKEKISQAVAPIMVKARGWEELYDFIKSHFSHDIVSQEGYYSPYFKDEVSEIIFYLLELEGEARLKKLNINNRYYKDKQQANIWKNEMMKKIHPDQSHHEKAEEATKELNKLYGSMIKFAK